MPRRGFLAALAATAEFVETNRSKKANQRETGAQLKEQRQYGIAKHQSEQNKPENGINHAQDNCVTWYGLEIFPAQAQRVAQIGQAKLSNDSRAGITERVSFRLCDVLEILGGHGRISFSRRTVETTRTLSPRIRPLMSGDRGGAECGKPGSRRRSFAGRHLSRPVL